MVLLLIDNIVDLYLMIEKKIHTKFFSILLFFIQKVLHPKTSKQVKENLNEKILQEILKK